jgi:hypothetical protein
MQKKRTRKERRREPRFEARIWVGIPEAEGEADVERCNISAGGMLLYTGRDAGEPGAVRLLRLVTGDLSDSVEVMAHVVRVHAALDSDGQKVRKATAFEFLTHRPEELIEFLGIALDGSFSVPAPDRRALQLDGELPDPQADLAASLEISRIVLDSNRVLAEGTRISLELEEPDGESLQLSGTCIESLPLDGADKEDLYRVSVGLDAATDKGIASESGARDRTGMNLSGSLSEVAIMSLLGFLELERSSGVLSIQHESEKASIFISGGNVLDVEADPAGLPAMESLVGLLAWSEGTFEFNFQSVDRLDVIGRTTTSLIMECAQLQDEADRSK